jgi:hypothetical protein
MTKIGLSSRTTKQMRQQNPHGRSLIMRALGEPALGPFASILVIIFEHTPWTSI